MVDSLGIRTEECSQIMVFCDEKAFLSTLEANPHIKALFGAKEHEKRMFPGIYIAGVTES